MEKWRTDTQDPITLIDPINEELETKIATDLNNDPAPSLEYLIFQASNKATENRLSDADTPSYWQLTDVFRKTFFWYTGSMTTPPCREGVQRFVFEQPIYITQSQFEGLKAKAFNNDIEDTGNARALKPQGKMRVYYHTDNGIKCANYSASMSTESTLDTWDSDHTKETMSVDLTKIKKSYVRASNVLTTYGYTGADVPDFEAYGLDQIDPGARQSIALSRIDPAKEDDPLNGNPDLNFPNAKAKLLQEASKVLKETCKSSSTETYAQMRENASKTAIHVPWFDRRRR